MGLVALAVGNQRLLHSSVSYTKSPQPEKPAHAPTERKTGLPPSSFPDYALGGLTLSAHPTEPGLLMLCQGEFQATLAAPYIFAWLAREPAARVGSFGATCPDAVIAAYDPQAGVLSLAVYPNKGLEFTNTGYVHRNLAHLGTCKPTHKYEVPITLPELTTIGAHASSFAWRNGVPGYEQGLLEPVAHRQLVAQDVDIPLKATRNIALAYSEGKNLFSITVTRPIGATQLQKEIQRTKDNTVGHLRFALDHAIPTTGRGFVLRVPNPLPFQIAPTAVDQAMGALVAGLTWDEVQLAAHVKRQTPEEVTKYIVRPTDKHNRVQVMQDGEVGFLPDPKEEEQVYDRLQALAKILRTAPTFEVGL